jgi:hypothetical protein
VVAFNPWHSHVLPAAAAAAAAAAAVLVSLSSPEGTGDGSCLLATEANREAEICTTNCFNTSAGCRHVAGCQPWTAHCQQQYGRLPFIIRCCCCGARVQPA